MKTNILKSIKYFYYNIVPYDYRPAQLLYRLECFLFRRYRTIHPRTLPGHTWIDRDVLFIHCSFEILSNYIEKEQGEYKEEDYNYYYTDCPDRLIEFGDSKKEPHYILNYLYNWWHQIYIKKCDITGKQWCDFHEKNKIVLGSEKGLYEFNYKSKEQKIKSKQLFRRYMKKDMGLEKELQDNLILLVKCMRSMWT